MQVANRFFSMHWNAEMQELPCINIAVSDMQKLKIITYVGYLTFNIPLLWKMMTGLCIMNWNVTKNEM